jgi:hypothetical protein
MTTPSLRLAMISMAVAAALVAVTTPTKTYHCRASYDDEPVSTNLPRRDFGEPFAGKAAIVPATDNALVQLRNGK